MMSAAEFAMKSDPERNYQFTRFRPPDPENAKPRRGQSTGQIATKAQQQEPFITALLRHAARLARAEA
jgi:hypothetical protein